MDFSYSEEQEAVRELAGRIFTERATHERLKAIEAAAEDEGPIDRELWAELAAAGLLGIHLGGPHRRLRAGRRDHGLRRAAH
jgi:3-oxocholest-4-en-26-oyl-CoA dehydrogenase beta subunit